jgi:hypothetical protein
LSCPGRGSNPHAACAAGDFKTAPSRLSRPRKGVACTYASTSVHQHAPTCGELATNPATSETGAHASERSAAPATMPLHDCASALHLSLFNSCSVVEGYNCSDIQRGGTLPRQPLHCGATATPRSHGARRQGCRACVLRSRGPVHCSPRRARAWHSPMSAEGRRAPGARMALASTMTRGAGSWSGAVCQLRDARSSCRVAPARAWAPRRGHASRVLPRSPREGDRDLDRPLAPGFEMMTSGSAHFCSEVVHG